MRQETKLPLIDFHNKYVEIVIILGSIMLITYLHFVTKNQLAILHEVLRLLYYIPVIYACFRFGLKGGIITPLIVNAVYILYLGTGDFSKEYYMIRLLDASITHVIGLITGLLVEVEAHQKRKLELLNQKQQQLNIELEQRIKEKLSLENQLVRADKLAALGQMVAGMAHELRNPLGVIKATMQVMEKEQNDQEVSQFSQIVIEECMRMNRVITELIKFSRPQMEKIVQIDLQDLLEQFFQFMKPYFEENRILLFWQKGLEPAFTVGDFQQLIQVLLNLVLNAAEAMPAGGRLTVELVPQGNYWCIQLTDTGCGIFEEDIDKIFDPFYTSKAQGTGLGLSVVHRIVDEHHGYLKVETVPGEGSTFFVYLPAKLYHDLGESDEGDDSEKNSNL